MGCKLNDTQMIVSYNMGAYVFSHSSSVRLQILSLLTIIYMTFHLFCSDLGIGSERPAGEVAGSNPTNMNFPAVSPNCLVFELVIAYVFLATLLSKL